MPPEGLRKLLEGFFLPKSAVLKGKRKEKDNEKINAVAPQLAVVAVDKLGSAEKRKEAMGSGDLKEAKKRVKLHLVEPLMRLGLRRASGVTVAQFDATIDELCGRLSYMTAINLNALAEQASRLAGGKDRSLFPSSSKILGWAADIQQPEDSTSPLLIAVFSGPLGCQAMAEDWAPELRSYVRKERIWPRGGPLDTIKERAREARRRLELIEEARGRGHAPNPVDLDMQKKRVAAAEKCERIMRQIEVSK
jgi:hypothetical protein